GSRYFVAALMMPAEGDAAGEAAADHVAQDGAAERALARARADDGEGARREDFVKAVRRHGLNEQRRTVSLAYLESGGAQRGRCDVHEIVSRSHFFVDESKLLGVNSVDTIITKGVTSCASKQAKAATRPVARPVRSTKRPSRRKSC